MIHNYGFEQVRFASNLKPARSGSGCHASERSFMPENIQTRGFTGKQKGIGLDNLGATKQKVRIGDCDFRESLCPMAGAIRRRSILARGRRFTP